MDINVFCKSCVWLLVVCLAACSTKIGADHPDGPPLQQRQEAGFKEVTPQPTILSASGNPKAYQVRGKTYRVMKQLTHYKQKGIASWYGRKFHSRKTSSGEPYDMFAMTAAHKTLPLPTYARVTNLQNGKQIVVKINDRGPFHDDRLIDLSYAAAKRLGIMQQGTAMVEIDAIVLPKIDAQSDDLSEPQRFYQVGAYKNPISAKKMITKIESVIHPPIQMVKSSSDGLNKVIIGPIINSSQELSLRNKLKQLGISGGMLLFK